MADELSREIESQHVFIDEVYQEIGKRIIGQQHLIKRLLIALLCDGHVLVEGVPGLAKTTSLKVLAQAMEADFQRIQFTPDLLPADIIGTEVYHPDKMAFSVKKGPIFSNVILVDEINRAPAKVQSALLEAMQERQVTLAGETFRLQDPFLVMATQNPIEQEGTYPLPEAQLDRFMMKITLGYPTHEDENAIVQLSSIPNHIDSQPVLTHKRLMCWKDLASRIYLDPKLLSYIVDIVSATRNPEAFGLDLADWIQYGASPRASIFMSHTARAHAMLTGRPFVLPEDIKAMAPDVLRHRIILSYEAEAQEKTTDELISQVLGGIEIP